MKNFKFLFLALLINCVSCMAMVPYTFKKPSIKKNFLSLLKEILRPTKTTAEIEQDISSVQEEIKTISRSIKQQDVDGVLIENSDIDKIIKLWKDLKTFYNYHWLDSLFCRSKPSVCNNTSSNHLNAFFRKNISMLLHPDKLTKKLDGQTENQGIVSNAFAIISDCSRPNLPFDNLQSITLGILGGVIDLSILIPTFLLNKKYKFFEPLEVSLTLRHLENKNMRKEKELRQKRIALSLLCDEIRILDRIQKFNG